MPGSICAASDPEVVKQEHGLEMKTAKSSKQASTVTPSTTVPMPQGFGEYTYGACPCCGYCPHCGRGGQRFVPYNPTGPTWTVIVTGMQINDNNVQYMNSTSGVYNSSL